MYTLQLLSSLALLLLCANVVNMAKVAPAAPPTPVANNALLPPVTAAPPPTLSQDLTEIYSLFQFKSARQLVERYLINDAQFQAFVRIINSQQAFALRLRFRSQPEIIEFMRWVNTQLLLSGGPVEMEKSEIKINLINRFPYWSTSVFGIQGFLYELQMYFPQYVIRGNIDAKVLQNGIFAQFWARLKALQPVYERFLTLPETQALLAQLQAAAIDTNLLDQFIRELLDWFVVPATTTSTTLTAASVAISGATLV